ncbi:MULTISPECIES: phosphoribosylamine--glycine ligase [unclassified Wenzhouxiangella]|uniref:phosphoribosylamine--glycine ligase n=1 Tax=unclassified Wenzhouxiangella TaxID=2613841 RepID=UPI000E3299A3|nr:MULTISPECIES: phosphoribosylamine--glycine ligase [unclassified Wenzhouxiangella]RFF26588.1 phosphoribosylamine--glycine ligase [Wenzhouxiangella sp. 15181]RFP70203.1 phosphoribosylamine--glycine ligase [Wenzhouxiangella sp. 15190]
MKLLVVGGGGREHALAWKLAQSEKVREVIVAPGNAGTASEPGMRNADVGAEDIDGLIELAKSESVGLTVVGPEAPLAAGIVDRFQAAGLACFGPSADAARLESSKAFAKDFMSRHDIPTGAFGVVDDVEEGMEMIHGIGLPVVLKADGLAAGKGVVIVETEKQARATLEDMLSGEAFGKAGRRVVIEEFLVGEEASFIVVAGGKQYLSMASSQDHKRRDDDDRGPNTGGMGAYSPAPVVDEDVHRRIIDDIIEPALDGLATDGWPFTGFLYAGVMLTATGPKVLEFNVRFGDPETQPIMLRLKSDLVEIIEHAIDGTLDRISPEWDERTALAVVMAAGGYPGSYEKGRPITGLKSDFPEDVKVFHAGTALDDQGRVVTSGGRVLALCALGDTPKKAQARAYQWIAQIGFEDAFYRSDIGFRAIGRG